MLKLLKGHEVSALDIGSTAPDSLEFGFRRCIHGKPPVKILPPSLPEELRTSAMFLLLNLFHLLDHRGREGYGEGVCGSRHSLIKCYLLTLTIFNVSKGELSMRQPGTETA